MRTGSWTDSVTYKSERNCVITLPPELVTHLSSVVPGQEGSPALGQPGAGGRRESNIGSYLCL